MSKANAIFRRVGDDLEMLSEYLELHEADFEPMTNGFLQSLAENMQKQLKGLRTLGMSVERWRDEDI
jgi:hypothetical protein